MEPNLTPINDSIVKLKAAESLQEIFTDHRTFDEVAIPERSELLSSAEGKIDSIELDPKDDTVFTFRINDNAFRLPFEAIDLDEFEERMTRTKKLSVPSKKEKGAKGQG